MLVYAEPRARWTRSRVALAIAALLLVAVGAILVVHARPSSSAPPRPQPLSSALDPPATSEMLIFVSGAVVHPGLYHLAPDARVADAVALAGGLTADADPGRLPNLAARVHDGRQVNVPLRRTASTPATARLDLNSASVEELRSVPGMPAGLAEAIVQHRTDWGPFTSVGELVPALGVERPTVTGLGHYLRVVPAAP